VAVLLGVGAAPLLRVIRVQQVDERVIGRDVAAGLSRHFSIVLNVGWRHKAASPSFFISLLEILPPFAEAAHQTEFILRDP